MITRLLIANRGEIARRIMRTCRDLGTETVAVFSDPDADSAFVREADLAVPLGGDTPADSYLRADAVVAAALAAGADAVHPGYGFLAENAEFADSVEAAGLVFVGPSADVMAAMGSKLAAKELMGRAGVPLLPSVELSGLDDSEIVSAVAEIGHPVLLKASAGGGGKGMRVVESADGLLEAVAAASREAESSFGDGTVYAERYVSPSRHVEVQIFGDRTGRVVHFHERECSIQRRHQKIIEEAPSPSLDDHTRGALHEAAVRAGEAIGYVNAGTVEFLLAPAHDDEPPEFFFLEVNTRLQVEHAVTEAILGFDLVALQLEVASGGEVPDQAAIGPVDGHAVEARLYAEDPTAGFRPSSGRIHRFAVPGGVRVDGALDGEGEVSRYYDPMIAKVVAHSESRDGACRRLAASLARARIDGIVTNRALLVRTLRHPEFLGDRGDSEFLVRNDPAELGRPLVEDADLDTHLAAAALAGQVLNRRSDRHTAHVSSGFRNVATAPQRAMFEIGDRTIAVDYSFERDRLAQLAVDGRTLVDPVAYGLRSDSVDLAVGGVRRRYEVDLHDDDTVSVASSAGTVVARRLTRLPEPADAFDAGSTMATMPGTIVEVRVAEGATVEPGAVLVVMEAMKMELSITTGVGGVVNEVLVAPGDSVEAGAVLVVLEEQSSDPLT